MAFASLPIEKSLWWLNRIAFGFFLLEAGSLVWLAFGAPSFSDSSVEVLVKATFFIAAGIYLSVYVRSYYTWQLRAKRGLLFFGLGGVIRGVAEILTLKEDLIPVHVGLRAFDAVLFLLAFTTTLAGSRSGGNIN